MEEITNDRVDHVAVSRLRRLVPPLALSWVTDAPERTWRTVDGTLCFADISGFTALSERLESRGRRGAEELVDVLNRVFGAMLDIAAARGGELLKFGGDALLLWFHGQGHAARAAASTTEMHRELRRAADEPTAFGRLRLSMSVGLASGDTHMFLVGAPHRELVVAGPVLDATIAAEHAARSGETLLAPATAAQLPATASIACGDGHHLRLRWRRAPQAVPAEAEAMVAPAPPEALGRLLPPKLAAALAAGVEPGHRSAAIAFIRLSGTDAVLKVHGPERLAVALDETLRHVQAALVDADITLLTVDVDTDGAKIVCAAGVPTSNEDDDARMMRALRRIVTSTLPLAVQAGVNRGHVFVAEIGSSSRAAYTAMGDTTNTAARIAAQSPVGHLYAHPVVLERIRTRYASEPAGPFVFKGKAEPLVVYDVGASMGPREDAGGGGLPMIGREDETATVLAAVARVADGHGGVLTISGPAGLGKTRLARETVNSSTLPQFISRSEPYGATTSYRSLRDPLRKLLGVERDTAPLMTTALLAAVDHLAPDLLPFAPLIGDVAHVEVPSTPEVEEILSRNRPDRTADIVIELLARAQPGPVIIGADDAQWADEATAHLLGRIAVASGELPWLLVVVRRDGAGGFAPESGEHVPLGPLDDRAIRALTVAATEATPLRPHEVAAIVAQAAGSPLYVEEWARAAQLVGSFDVVPESINAVVSTQVDALSAAARRALGDAAVLGRSFRHTVLDAVLAAENRELDEPTREDLDRFLEPDGPERLRFRNGLVRDVVYESLAYRTRSRLHELAATVIERASDDVSVDAEVLAEHFWRAGDAERTWHHSLVAADRARTVAANADAAMHFERALEAARRLDGVTDDERVRLLVQLGDVRQRAGLLDSALDAHRRESRLLKGSSRAQADLALRRAHTYERAGSYGHALRDAARARELAAGFEDAAAAQFRAECLAFAALVRQRQERIDAALALAERAVQEGDRSGAVVARARASSVTAWAAMMLGRADAAEWARRALELFEHAEDLDGQADAANNLGVHAYYDGRWDETLQMYGRSREASERSGNVIDAASCDANIGEVLVNQGRLIEAEAVLRDARRVLRASGHRWGAAFAEMHLGRLFADRGDLADAEELLASVRQEFRALGRTASVYEASLHLADCVSRSGRAEEALEILAQIRHLRAGDLSILDAARSRIAAGALLRLGRHAEASSAVTAGIAVARQRHLEYELTLLLEMVDEVDGNLETGSPTPPEVEAAQLRAKLDVVGRGETPPAD